MAGEDAAIDLSGLSEPALAVVTQRFGDPGLN
jgi:hypothetical protein